MSTALVTGASAGLGATFARKLAARGHDLILVARREERLREFAKELPTRAETIAADLSTDEGIAAIERAIHGCATLEVLVNNAGFGTLGRFWETDFAAQDRMHRLHVMAAMHLTHAAVGDMVARGKGGIINVSSVAAFAQNTGNVSYCSTKAWMNSFTLGLDLELRSVGSAVTVQALCPGFTITEFHDVVGIKREGIPQFLWLHADDVVEASLRGLDAGKVIVVPDWKYKIAVAALKYMPGALTRGVRPGRDQRV